MSPLFVEGHYARHVSLSIRKNVLRVSFLARMVLPMSQAATIIERFGSMSALARAIDPNLPASVVQGWKERGTIPVRWHKRILSAAVRDGISLTPNDFFVGLE